MLALFNRYIVRMQVDHEVIGNRELFVLILSYLDGEDLFSASQVSFYWKSMIKSTPSLEVRMLHFSLERSNSCIVRLTSEDAPVPAPAPRFNVPVRSFMIPTRKQISKPVQQNTPQVEKNFEENSLISEQDSKKWENFIEYFYVYARVKGFKIKKKEDFASQKDWERYEQQLETFYCSYVHHIKQNRPQQNKKIPFKDKLAETVENWKADIGVTFHFLTNYRFFHYPPIAKSQQNT